MTTVSFRKHQWAEGKTWKQTQPDGFGSMVVARQFPTATREDVDGGFVWWLDGRIVAECQMNPHRGTWFGWYEGR